MTSIAMFSDKGSPGVTTLGLALATVWSRRVGLVELDPAGGDLLLRMTDRAGRPVIQPEPGLLTLAAEARRDGGAAVWEHGQYWLDASDAVVVPGLFAPEQAPAMARLWQPVIDTIGRAEGGDVIADLGRLDPTSAVMSAAAGADVLVAVSRGEPDAMLRLRDRLRQTLNALAPRPQRRLLVALIVEDRRAPEARAAMREVLAHGGPAAESPVSVSFDPSAVTALYEGETSGRLHRSLFMRSVSELAAALGAEPTTTPVKHRLFARSR